MRHIRGGFSTPYMTRILLKPDGETEGTEKETEGKTHKPVTAADVAAKHGGESAALLWAVSKINDLEKDTHKQREEIRTLKASAPASGSRVLSAEELAEWQKYRDLGKPDDLKAAVKEREDLSKRVAASDREKELRSIAASKSLKWNADALLALAKDDDQFIEVEKKDSNGNTIKGEDDKPMKIWAVKGAKEGDAPIPVTERFSAFLPSLAPKAEGEEIGTPNREFRRVDPPENAASTSKQPLFRG